MTTERLQQLEDMLRETPNDVFLLYAIALETFKTGQNEFAIEKLRLIIDFSPEYLPAYFRLGQWLAECDKIEESRVILLKASSLARAQQDHKALQEIEELLLFIDDYEI